MRPEDERPEDLEKATYMKSELDLDLDLESSTPASRKQCWWFPDLLLYLFFIVVLGTAEVCLEVFMLGPVVLWPAIFLSVCVNIVITYISIRSAIHASAHTELWRAIKTRQVPSKPVEEQFQWSMWRVIGYAIAWDLLSMALSRKL